MFLLFRFFLINGFDNQPKKEKGQTCGFPLLDEKSVKNILMFEKKNINSHRFCLLLVFSARYKFAQKV
jgi:hypothetical protein